MAKMFVNEVYRKLARVCESPAVSLTTIKYICTVHLVYTLSTRVRFSSVHLLSIPLTVCRSKIYDIIHRCTIKPNHTHKLVAISVHIPIDSNRLTHSQNFDRWCWSVYISLLESLKRMGPSLYINWTVYCPPEQVNVQWVEIIFP